MTSWPTVSLIHGFTSNLECGAGGVVGVGLYLYGLLEHDAERGRSAVTLKTRVVLTTHLTRVCVDDLKEKNMTFKSNSNFILELSVECYFTKFFKNTCWKEHTP